MAANDCKPLPPLGEKYIERFRSMVDERGADECWPWVGGTFVRGYGVLSVCINGKESSVKTTRVAYFLHYGIDPFPQFVLHTCDNPPCCNPAHLYRGTPANNMADKVSRGRQSRGDSHRRSLHPARGESAGNVRLTGDLVIYIREQRALGRYGTDIARELGVGNSCVYAIIEGLTWRHI